MPASWFRDGGSEHSVGLPWRRSVGEFVSICRCLQGLPCLLCCGYFGHCEPVVNQVISFLLASIDFAMHIVDMSSNNGKRAPSNGQSRLPEVGDRDRLKMHTIKEPRQRKVLLIELPQKQVPCRG
ncbi:hypothetical protein Cni_G28030 [Canna indica]|uniref:Uncharacterized protein n=1 Tax=Canna indica TaxID=4628 RepID=A0AAQ3L8U7_9LILI|nr:hypothetical protein Cni_G28030 [Canna indica]